MSRQRQRQSMQRQHRGAGLKGRRFACLLIGLAIGLALSGCSLLNQPTGSGTTGSSTAPVPTTASQTTQTAQTTPAPTSTQAAPTTVPSTTRAPTTAPTVTTQPTATSSAPTQATSATTRPTSTGTTASTTAPTTPSTTVDLSKLSHTVRGWSYNRTATGDLFKDVRVTIPSSISSLIAPWSVIWQARATGQKTVYLTMDEGYEFETNSTEILDTLARKKVHAAFFITGSYLRSQPELVRRMVREGHLVLNHTDGHPNLANLYAESGAAAVLAEMTRLETAFRSVTGQSMPRLLRPPEGAYSERLLGLLKQSGYRPVFWSFAYRDWLTAEQPTQAEARRLILGELHDGSVMLLHAVSDTNVALLPALIDEIRARGYRFGRLTDIP